MSSDHQLIKPPNTLICKFVDREVAEKWLAEQVGRFPKGYFSDCYIDPPIVPVQLTLF